MKWLLSPVEHFSNLLARTLERSFRLILKASVENYSSPITVTYITPGEHSRQSETFHSLATLKLSDVALPASTGIIMHPSSLAGDENSPPNVILRVISPIFYSRFFHYQSSHAAFAGELLDNACTRTLWSSDPSLFASIFSSTATASFTPIETISYPSSSNRRHWWLLSLLRGAPTTTNYPRSAPYDSFNGVSSMDRWVLEHCSPKEVKDYRRAILRVFIGEWIGGAAWPLKQFSDDLEPFGLSIDALLRIYDTIIKATTVTGAVEVMRMLDTGCDVWIIGVAGWITTGVNLWACLKASV